MAFKDPAKAKEYAHKQKITSDQFDYLNVLITHAELNQPLQQVTLPVQGDLFKDQQS